MSRVVKSNYKVSTSTRNDRSVSAGLLKAITRFAVKGTLGITKATASVVWNQVNSLQSVKCLSPVELENLNKLCKSISNQSFVESQPDLKISECLAMSICSEIALNNIGNDVVQVLSLEDSSIGIESVNEIGESIIINIKPGVITYDMVGFNGNSCGRTSEAFQAELKEMDIVLDKTQTIKHYKPGGVLISSTDRNKVEVLKKNIQKLMNKKGVKKSKKKKLKNTNRIKQSTGGRL